MRNLKKSFLGIIYIFLLFKIKKNPRFDTGLVYLFKPNKSIYILLKANACVV